MVSEFCRNQIRVETQKSGVWNSQARNARKWCFIALLDAWTSVRWCRLVKLHWIVVLTPKSTSVMGSVRTPWRKGGSWEWEIGWRQINAEWNEKINGAKEVIINESKMYIERGREKREIVVCTRILMVTRRSLHNNTIKTCTLILYTKRVQLPLVLSAYFCYELWRTGAIIDSFELV